MYRPAPRPLTLVFPTRALPLKDDSASASRSGDGAAAAYRGRPAMHGRLEIAQRNPVAAKACDLIMPSFSGLRPRAHVGVFACRRPPSTGRRPRPRRCFMRGQKRIRERPALRASSCRWQRSSPFADCQSPAGRATPDSVRARCGVQAPDRWEPRTARSPRAWTCPSPRS